MTRPPPRLAQCKTNFSYVFCYKQLDGSLSDGLLEESLCLLMRASWRADRGANLPSEATRAPGHPADSLAPSSSGGLHVADLLTSSGRHLCVGAGKGLFQEAGQGEDQSFDLDDFDFVDDEEDDDELLARHHRVLIGNRRCVELIWWNLLSRTSLLPGLAGPSAPLCA